MNINLAINEGSKILKKKFITNPLLDAEILMAKTINKDRNYILLNSSNSINKNDLNNFYKLIEQRSLGNPVAYLIKKKSFWKSEFFITKGALIPRPDTELVVENILRLTKQKSKINILDIGVGSGCIIVSILKERENFRGTGIDLSKKCLIISKKNAIAQKVSSRLKLYKSDVDKFNLGKYDLIVSNPPYIKTCKFKYLEKDVAEFEPRLALDGGLDGLSEIRKVIKKSSELIKKNGKLILEIGFDQKNKVKNLLKKEGFYIDSTQKDLADNDRCIISTKI
ncbi:peptide chain release factor N(5)-glutamine methyltransferase [Candidatus Pelagibacter sp. FZCC0015]|uniref:peptide chain release factor N(5)-glutamine methyltransferase n=1 Tax=Candidatus Pelagibacter sp. FZCC0015 TaxID=2268451 RepID=UPI0011A42DC7|nr:peptide chain release factor N(5)-glutamine methyltransferase [Candidatus Pelagibacter sp. FZCC0015]